MSPNNVKNNDIKNRNHAQKNVKNYTKKAPINTEMLKNANRRQKQPDKAQKPPHTTNAKPAPPDNDKMIDKRRKPTKPRAKRASSGIKETYHRKTSRQATKQP